MRWSPSEKAVARQAFDRALHREFEAVILEEIIVAGGQLREGRFSRMNVGETQAAAAAASDCAGAPIRGGLLMLCRS
jgi:hypothetical protein